MKRLSNYQINSQQDLGQLLWMLDAEVEFWYSYVHFGLKNEFQKHSRKDQRIYQRKLCSWLARRNAIKASYPEYLL